MKIPDNFPHEWNTYFVQDPEVYSLIAVTMAKLHSLDIQAHFSSSNAFLISLSL